MNDTEKVAVENAAGSVELATATWARKELLKAAHEAVSSQAIKAPAPGDDHPSLLSLFCGPGGLDQGFKEAGFHTSLAFDIDDESVKTFGRNHTESAAFVRDINELTLDELDELNEGIFAPTGVIGGPPCQSFSVSNVHQKDDDPRHKLPETYARLLKQLNIRNPISFFLFENVPGLLGNKHIEKYNEFKMLFDDAGFDIFEAQLNAKHYGVPQDRPRVFIIGINKEKHADKEWVPPEKKSRLKSVKSAIWGLPEPVYNERGLDPETFPVHPNHWCLVPRSKKFSEGRLEEGQMFGRSFRTLRWSEPSWAVAYGHREVHVHPNGHRRLSIYEAMKLQTFPDSYVLTGNMSAQIRLVSEAVPVKLAWHLAQSIRQALDI